MSFSVEGKAAIVTGAAHGIGLAIARHLVGQGARVMFADMDEARLKDEVAGIDGGTAGGNIARFAGDLRERLTLANLMSATIDQFDRLDILVNASRQVGANDPAAPLDLDELVEQQIQQNLMTCVRMTQIAARRMVAQADGEGGEEPRPAGSIVNITSIAARRVQPQLLGFSVAAAALDQFTRAAAVALAPHGIRVNAVATGSVMSATLKETLRDHKDYREEILCRTPLHRIASPAEVAETVQFLASDGSGFMTGQILTVDGGRALLDPVASPAH